LKYYNKYIYCIYRDRACRRI